MSLSTLEVLIKARAEVEKGWCQRSIEKWSGEVCAIGALRRVMPAHKATRNTVVQTLIDALPSAADRHVMAIGRFNDDPSTTKADVLALYDRAINSLVPVGDTAHVHRVA